MKTLRNVISMVLALFVVTVTSAQSETMTLSHNTSSLTIEGTSNLHDWEEEVTDFSGSVTLAGDINSLGSENPIKNIELTAKVESIESGKSIMNNKTHDALKADDHPTITFKSTKSKLYKTKDAANGSYVFIVYGDVTIAGQTKEIYFPVNTSLNEDGTWNVKGSKKLYLKWFDIERPSAMMGTVTVGDEVEVKFDVNLQPSDQTSN